MSVTPGTRLGVYEVVESIGSRDGRGVRARDSRLRRDVALKVLPAQHRLDPDRQARFEREALALAALNHPNIATVHGVEDAAGIQVLVMELVDGTLAERIDRHVGGLPSGERLYRRTLDRPEATPMAGTEGATSPFFSPDGASVGFFANRRLKRVSVEGGTVIDIAAAPNFPAGASWGIDDRIVFANHPLYPLTIYPSWTIVGARCPTMRPTSMPCFHFKRPPSISFWR